MQKEKSNRNKTIELSEKEIEKYLTRCVSLTRNKMNISDISNKTIIGDTLKIMEKLPHEFVDLLIADPPYNLEKDFNGNKFSKKSESDYREYTIEWVDKVIPLLKENASIYVCCDWKSSLIIGEVLSQKLHVQNRITWQREKGRGAKDNWKNGMEDIWFATKTSNYTFNLDAVKIRKKVIAPYKKDGEPKDWEETEQGKVRNTCPSNFWDDISIPYWSMSENTVHPTQKPEKLLAKLILASSNEGDIILDPFLGSGTTSVTAKKLGRSYVGIEQNELYCALAEKRLEMSDSDYSIQGYCNGVFWERNSNQMQKKMNRR